MKIAFLLLCHRDPDQINNLIDKLCEFSEVDIYVHVDINHKEIRKEIQKKNNVYLLDEEESFCIKWGNVSMVRATLQLIRKAKESAKGYDYLWLISGQDYPICSIQTIEERLSQRPSQDYIETVVCGDKRYNRYKKLYELAYPSWINANNVIVKSIKRTYMIITGGYNHTFRFLVRKKPFDFDFSFGSQWWTLTSRTAYSLLDYSDRNPEILSYFEKSIIPDECFFQTLYVGITGRTNTTSNITYINWGNNKRSPEILSEKDYDTLAGVSDKYCFARKFMLPDSQKLMEKLDSRYNISNG